MAYTNVVTTTFETPSLLLHVDNDDEIYAGQFSVEVQGTISNKAVTARIVSGDQYVYVRNFELVKQEPEELVLTTGRGAWRVPAGVHSISILCQGAGGNCPAIFAPEVLCNGGAGGGLSSSTELVVTPGQLIYYNVPTARAEEDTWVSLVGDAPPSGVLDGVLAKRGSSGQPGLATPGGQAANGVGQVKYSGASLPAPEYYYDEVESGYRARTYGWGEGASEEGNGTYYEPNVYDVTTGPYGYNFSREDTTVGLGSRAVVAWLSGTSFTPPNYAYPCYGGPGLVHIIYQRVEIGFDVPTLAELLDNGIKLGSVTFEIVK